MTQNLIITRLMRQKDDCISTIQNTKDRIKNEEKEIADNQKELRDIQSVLDAADAMGLTKENNE